MCICVNCHYVDRCTTYHAVEMQHQQPHLTENPNFEANEPSINVNIRTQGEIIEWSKLRPGELVPT
jgi:hypothetical protein